MPEVIELDPSRLITTLQSPPSVPPPVILPDFFLDHFVIAGSFDEFVASLESLARQGGGNLLGTSQFISRGGNSVNTASALISLGIHPTLIAKTDSQGLSLLKSLVHPGLDLSHVKSNGRLSATVSIEVEYEGHRVNLMVSDSGSVADFSFADLDSTDLQAISASGLVALLCLNHNKNAVELTQSLFEYTRKHSSAQTFLDLGDPSGNPAVISQLVKTVLHGDLVDIISMNENEAGWVASMLTGDKKWQVPSDGHEQLIAAAQLISRETGVRVDLHTALFSATLYNDVSVIVPSFSVPVNFLCGAGDSWNAGDIYATLLSLTDNDRLMLANAIAALYISSTDASHPSLSTVIHFLQEQSEPLK